MGDIETSATAAIKIRLADTDLLSQYINERDKEPIWDGFIYAYKNKYKKNDDLIGRAPVQVKGKTVKRFSKKNPKYKVSITNLEKYRNDGGVLYFVVHIDADKNKKIYYAALQPFLINQYLRIAQSKKPISINLKELPDKPNDFENIVINFIEESQKQSILKTGKNWTIEEVEKLLGRDNMRMNCHFTCIGYDRNDPFSYLKNNELYLHIQNPDGTLSFPVEHLESVESVITERSINVYSNGHKYYDLVKVERHKDETLTLYFGKSFKYIWERDKQTLKYALTGNLDERLQDLRFIIDVFDTKCLTVNGLDLPVSPTKKEIESFDIEGARVTLKYYELIKEMLDILHVSIPLDMDKLTEKQEDYVKMLINTIVHKKSAGFKEKGQIPPVVSLEISNIRLLLFFGQRSDELYDVKDFFEYDIDCKLDESGDYPTTQYCIMNERDYAYSANINIEKIKAAFMKYDNQGHRNRMVFSILEMIKAYDASKKKELLEMALELCKWLEEKEPENYIHVINRIQCEIRLREISDSEIAELMEILKTDINQQSKAGIQILMGNKRLADHYIGLLDDETKKTFIEYPIYHLYKELT